MQVSNLMSISGLVSLYYSHFVNAYIWLSYRLRPSTMVNRKSRKIAEEYAARTHLSDYLTSIGDVPASASAKAAAMRECARERWESWNGRRADRCHPEVICYLGWHFYGLNGTLS